VDPNVFDGLAKLIVFLFWVCVISVPLGLWKLVEIIIWLCNWVS
jgi:hypothetical protein